MTLENSGSRGDGFGHLAGHLVVTALGVALGGILVEMYKRANPVTVSVSTNQDNSVSVTI